MSSFLSVRLDPEVHGSSAVTTGSRVISLLSGLGLIAAALYLAFIASFNGRFMPGVVVAGQNLSNLTISQARNQLNEVARSYRLNLDVNGRPQQVTLDQVGASYDISSTLEQAYELGRRNETIAPNLPSARIAPLAFVYRINQAKLSQYTRALAVELGVPPRNASIVIKAGNPQIQPEESGWGVNDRALRNVIAQSLANSSAKSIAIRPHSVPAAINQIAAQPAVTKTLEILSTSLSLTFNDKVFVPDNKLMGTWITYELNKSGDGYDPKIDEAQLKNYINQISNQINIAPVNRKVTVENGVSTEKQVGVDGLAVDQDAAAKSVAAAMLSQQPLVYELASKPVAFKTETTNQITLDYGKYIEINLKKQHLWVYQDREVIFDSPLTSGATGAKLGTVTGLFSIYYKTTNTRLRGYQYGYNYDVAVKYWMPFHQGYGLHDASWRNGKFGGQDYYYNGSHGCVNLPDNTAEFIYKWANIGTPVWVHN